MVDRKKLVELKWRGIIVGIHGDEDNDDILKERNLYLSDYKFRLYGTSKERASASC